MDVSLQIERLTKVSEQEWIAAFEKCRKIINKRTGGKTRYGCHSETNLGTTPFDYYTQKAIDKLYEGKWTWQHEKYTFSEQLARMVDSIISAEVEKHKTAQKKKEVYTQTPLEDAINILEIPFDAPKSIIELEKIYEDQLNTIIETIDGNSDMESLFELIIENKPSSEICEKLGWEKKKLYKVTEKMKLKARTYYQSTNEVAK